MKWMMAEFHLEAQDPGIVQAASLSHCHRLLGHLNGTEPSLMLIVTPVLFLLLYKSKCQLWKGPALSRYSYQQTYFSQHYKRSRYVHGELMTLYILSHFNIHLIFLSVFWAVTRFVALLSSWKLPFYLRCEELLCVCSSLSSRSRNNNNNSTPKRLVTVACILKILWILKGALRSFFFYYW